jgi:hypothetical protein
VADQRPNWVGFIDTTRTITIVRPDGQGGTKADHTNQAIITQPYDPLHPEQPIVVTQTQPDGRVSTWEFRPSTQNDYNRLLNEWQQALQADHARDLAAAAAAREAGPCTVGVQGHDERITFSGDERHNWCSMLPRTTKYQYTTLDPAAGLQVVCTVAVKGAQATVLDSGGKAIGTDACRVLQKFGPSAAAEARTWDATQIVLDNLDKVKTATGDLAQATAGFGGVLSDYGKDLQNLQRSMATAQADAAKAKSASDCGTVRADAGGVRADLGSFRATDGSLRSAQQQVTTARQALAKSLAILDDATKAGPTPALMADAQAIAADAHQQLDTSDAAASDAQTKSTAYGDQSKSLGQQAADLATACSPSSSGH